MISAVVLTKNEEKNLERCLSSLQWCDEVIIIDDFSTDNTIAIAAKHGAAVYKRHLYDDFASQRNYGLELAAGDWVLFVDADEQVDTSLRDEIKKAIGNTSKDGFFLSRVDTLWGKELQHGELLNIAFLRLGKKGKGVWGGRVHETWQLGGTIGKLHTPLRHYPHQTLTEFLKEINYYTDIRAKELFAIKHSVSGAGVAVYPLCKFFVLYFLKGGFLDGVHGLIVSILMSFHSFLVRSKLWVLYNGKK